jgi:hypothetical protein
MMLDLTNTGGGLVRSSSGPAHTLRLVAGKKACHANWGEVNDGNGLLSNGVTASAR